MSNHWSSACSGKNLDEMGRPGGDSEKLLSTCSVKGALGIDIRWQYASLNNNHFIELLKLESFFHSFISVDRLFQSLGKL